MIIKPPPTIRTSSFLWLARSLSLSSSPTLVRNPKECWRPPPWNFRLYVFVPGTPSEQVERRWKPFCEIPDWRLRILDIECISVEIPLVFASFSTRVWKNHSIEIFSSRERALTSALKLKNLKRRYFIFIFYSQINPWYRKCNFPEEILSIS